MQGKYVMTKRGPILFPDTFLHANFKSLKPVSAGMFSVKDGEVEVFGNSLSLGLKPRSQDAAEIARIFGAG